jgi:hypothetical protein
MRFCSSSVSVGDTTTKASATDGRIFGKAEYVYFPDLEDKKV